MESIDYRYADGEIYNGEYMNGLMNGKGRYTYRDGRIYEGYFRDGQIVSGKGKFIK